jgi:hypothetical protein
MPGPFDLPVSAARDRWEPFELPRVLDGIVIPARSAVAREGAAVYTPAAALRTVSAVKRGVGFFTTGGQWVLVWEGDDPGDRDDALKGLLDDLAEYTRRRR